MILTLQDRHALVEAAGYYFQVTPPQDRPLAVYLNNLAMRVASSPSGGLSANEAEILRESLVLFCEAFPEDSQPQQSLLARFPRPAPFA